MTLQNQKIENFLKDPSAHFESPRDVLSDQKLSKHDKLEILRCWEEDEIAKQRAAEENMTAPDEQAKADDVLSLIGKLKDKL